MKKIFNFLKILLITFLLYLLQVSFVAGLPFPIYYWQIFLSLIIAYLFVYERNAYLIPLVIFYGILLSFYSIYPIFLIPLFLVLIIYIVEFSLNNFITDRSWQSLLLISLVSTAVFNLLLYSAKYVVDIYYLSSSNIFVQTFLLNLLWHSIFNFLGAIIFFVILRKINKVYG